MKVYLAADHGGFELKNMLLDFVRSLGYDVEDCGAFSLDANDDYPVFIQAAARKVSDDFEKGVESRAIVIGGSGQGEAFAANKIKHIRAVVYYGEPSRHQVDADGKELDMLTSTRDHNDANVLSLGGRFLTDTEVKGAVERWLSAPFSGAERHSRRHAILEEQGS